MPITTKKCPSPDVLCDYALGRLSEELASGVGAHVDNCPRCEQAVSRNEQERSLGVDQLEAALQASASRGDFDTEPELKHTLKILKTPPTTHTHRANDYGHTTAPKGGRYRVVRQFAAGGLGELFVAEDTILGREVALKEIRVGYAGSAESQMRFCREAEVTSRLQHPGIVPVYDCGQFEDGRPFYVMRLVQGKTLQAAIERYLAGKKTEPAGWRRLERDLVFRRLLRALIEVCHTTEYAHQQGILHRDIKPANIIVGDFGETILIDWGLASAPRDEHNAPQITGTTTASAFAGPHHTRASQQLGTPGYRSPEQASGLWEHVSTASDTYSLGATLYHMFSGRPPVDAAGQPLTSANIQRDLRHSPAGLRAVCCRAMAQNPKDRYASVSALAADLERWLADEPVAALREGLATRLRRWTRHHPAVLASITVTAVLMVAAFGIIALLSARWSGRERIARQDAEHAAQLATEMVAAHEALGRTIAKDASVASSKRSNAALEAFGKAAQIANRLREVQPDDPDLLDNLTSLYKRLGSTSLALGETTKAITYFHDALGIDEDLVHRFPNDPQRKQRLAASLGLVARTYEEIGEFNEAQQCLVKSRDVQLDLLKLRPNDTELQRSLVECYLQLGIDARQHGDKAAARQFLLEGRRLAESFLTAAKDHREIRHGLAHMHQVLGDLHMAEREPQQALENYRRDLQLIEQLTLVAPTNAHYQLHHTLSISFVAKACSQTQQYAEALDYFQRARWMCQQLLESDEENVLIHNALIEVERGTGDLYLERNQPDNALPYFQTAYELCSEIVDRDPHSVTKQLNRVYAIYRLAKTAQRRRAYREAIARFDEARSVLQDLHTKGVLPPRDVFRIEDLSNEIILTRLQPSLIFFL